MSMKNNTHNRNLWITGGVIIAVLILITFLRNPHKDQPPVVPSSNNIQTNTSSQPKPNRPQAPHDEQGIFTFVGRLEASDDATKGNIQITTKERTIHIRSSRDWSQLYGNDVVVKAEGSTTQFHMVDVTAK